MGDLDEKLDSRHNRALMPTLESMIRKYKPNRIKRRRTSITFASYNLELARVIRHSIAVSERDTLRYLLQAFSSDSSLQSGLPLQKSSLSTHSPLPHDNFPSGQTGSSVLRMGKTLRGSAKRNSH